MATSLEIFKQSQDIFPGGVNSPVRAFQAVGGTPLIIEKAKGAYIFSIEQERYIDYVNSWGASILGHAHPKIIQAVTAAIQQGLSFGAPTATELALGKTIQNCMPSLEMLRLVNSGTEATMTAIRLARGYTQRSKILKFAGCYHGHQDSLLVKGGSGIATGSLPDSIGVPHSTIQETLVASFNDLDSVTQIFEKWGFEIAAIIIEPIAANMNCILPKPHFLKNLQEICKHYDSLLIFDEVITGFRVHLGGAQTLYGIQPDLTTLGKIIGGGLPIGAVGGKKEIMQLLAPLGPVYQAGTLSGNPITATAGLAALESILAYPTFYQALEEKTLFLSKGIQNLMEKFNIPYYISHATGLLGLLFTSKKGVYSFTDILDHNTVFFKKFFHTLLEEKIYLPPSAFESCFISQAHTVQHLEKTLEAIEKILVVITRN